MTAGRLPDDDTCDGRLTRRALKARDAAAVLGASGQGHVPAPAAARCPRCYSDAVCRWGKRQPAQRSANVLQRWRCRGCCRTFSATTGTILSGVHAPEKFRALLADMLGPAPSSCRDLASRLDLDKTTVWAWRMKAAAGFAARRPAIPREQLAVGEVVVRESRKASRLWVDHAREPHRYPQPDRLRWLDYRLRGIAPPDWLPQYRIPVRFLGYHDGTCCAALSSGHDTADRLPGMDRIPAAPSWLPPNEPPPSGEACRGAFGRPSRSASSQGPRGCRQRHRSRSPNPMSASVAAASAPTHFRSFIRLFRGPATKNLSAYAAWFTARLRVGLPIAAGR